MKQKQVGIIKRINGPIIEAEVDEMVQMMELVHISSLMLIGEVLSIDKNKATIQVYEDTTGVKPGDAVYGSGLPLSVELGPGIIGNIFDGIQRPLEAIAEESGIYIGRGINLPSLNRTKKWPFKPALKLNDAVEGGAIVGTVQETSLIETRVLLAPDVSGKVVKIVPEGEYTVEDVVAIVRSAEGLETEVRMMHRWPVKRPRPVKVRKTPEIPLMTGQRIVDMFFPISKGGTAAIPGGFGTGKTITQHQLAKWADAQVIVYIGCGERGNEITEVLEEFPHLIDPRTGKSLIERTVLIANTSNMPVTAREASIYTGITLAEYYRDMGYHVAIMADSTSRWAEALREISGRLEEMPAEEGFPAYLPSRLSAFYERAGYMHNFNGTEGSVSIIGAVSPQGGDLSEPVTQNTKRFIRCFWALDKALAYARHYPAINWISSYSEYIADLKPWFDENVSPDFIKFRNEINTLLHEENKLMEIVKLIGSDVLPDDQKLVIEIARIIRVGFLQQNAFHAEDTFVPIQKQLKMMEIILHLYHRSKEIVAAAIPISKVLETGLYDKVVKIKYDIPNNKLELFDAYNKEIDDTFDKIIAGAKAAS